MIPYTQIPALAHFVLEESFVSDVTERPGEVSLRADLCYAKDHPELLRARRDEWQYYREGIIRFEGVTDFTWTDRTTPGVDADGSSAWGGIDSLTLEGRTYRIDADLGSMVIAAEGVTVEMVGPA